jgi:hypothetical protein
MPKSKYPQELDTSIEIPPVRDNIVDVGSDVINSIRDAIFKIERTLGLNPQGAVGNTLAERLDRIMDGNGNLKSDALSLANILSGPILNSDVSRIAAIHESKLKLDFPTTLLQDEISQVNGELQNIIDQVQELSTSLSVHLNSSATNRHPALSIGVAGKPAVGTDIAATELLTGSAQSALEAIYNSHVNYTGVSITSENNSHIAAQIHFDDTNISGIITSDDVQEAIEDLALASQNTEITHQDLFHSNGYLRVGKMDSSDIDGVGEVLIDGTSISFSSSAGGSSGLAVIILNDTIAVGDFDLKKSDILTITDPNDEDNLVAGSYEIANFTESGGFITELEIFGTIQLDSTSNSLGRISKNINTPTDKGGLLVVAREEASLLSARTVQVCNPDSVSVISSGILSSEITTINRFINISVDSGTSTSIDMYNGLVTKQSIDSVVSRINEQCAEESLDFLAYRADLESGTSELVIAHNLPDSGTDKHTITVSKGTDDGINSSGFSYIEDIAVSSKYGGSYFISGITHVGLKTKLDSLLLSFNSGAVIVNTGSSGINFLDAGLKSGNILTITDTNTSTDSGSYLISSVTETQLALDPGQLPSGFADLSGDLARFRVYSNIASFDSLTFDEVSGTFGAALLDVYLDENRDVISTKRFEYESISSSSVLVLTDFEGDVGGLESILTISGGTNIITLSLDGGPSKKIRGDNTYVWLSSGTSNVNLRFYIPSVGSINPIISSGGGADILMELFGFDGLNLDTNLFLARVPYDSFQGRVSGGVESIRSRAKLRLGSIGINEIGSDVRSVLQEVPLSELRSNGITYGLEVSNPSVNGDGFYVFDLSHGVAYVRGKRFIIPSKSGIITDILAATFDKIFIAINEDGNVVFESAIATCISPFGDSEDTLLASFEYAGISPPALIDLRLFINDLDLKILNAVTVSPQAGMGHFSSLGKAIRYAKRFSQIFPDAGIPTIHLKSGNYESIIESEDLTRTFNQWIVDLQHLDATVLTAEFDKYIEAGLMIDFPVTIEGEGNSTAISIINRYTFSDQTVDFRGEIGIPGDGFTMHTLPLDKITDGFVSIKNLRLTNTFIGFEDFNIDSGSSPYINGAVIENIMFDFRNFTSNTRDNFFGPSGINLLERNDQTINKGNIVIDKCRFIESIIFAGGLESGRVKNLMISDNSVMNDSTLGLFDQDFYTFADADSGSNISLIGNHNTSNFFTVGNASEPNITSGTEGWGDRFSRDIRVGGGVFAEDDVQADNFRYNSTRTRTRLYTMDENREVTSASSITSWIGAGGGSPSASSSSLVASGSTVTWPTFLLANTDTLRFRLDSLNPGEKIVGVRLGFEGDPSNVTRWSGVIRSGNISGGSPAVAFFNLEEQGSGPAPSFSTFNILSRSLTSTTSTTTTWDVDGASSKLWFIDVSHDKPIDTFHLYWIELTIEVDDIESVLGL